MRISIVVMSLLVVTEAGARQFTFRKRITPETLSAEFKAAGLNVKDFYSNGRELVVVMPDGDPGDPSSVVAAHVYTDSRAIFKRRHDALRALIVKWRTAGLTPAEKDDLLIRLAEHVMGAE